jgi:hypothetical protein
MSSDITPRRPKRGWAGVTRARPSHLVWHGGRACAAEAASAPSRAGWRRLLKVGQHRESNPNERLSGWVAAC